ncbi:MAG: hypothetical protein M9899_09875 [Bdellovibrionaceae bacterium]|nr:hypothetical protein [Pseudobdellovibrionaceae bacterium]
MKKTVFIYIMSLLPLSTYAFKFQANPNSATPCTGEDLTCDFSDSELREALKLDTEDTIDQRFLDSLNWEHYDFHDEDYDLSDGLSYTEENDLEEEDLDNGTSYELDSSHENGNDSLLKREARIYKANLKMPSNSAPIWPSFITNFKKCAPGCIPANYGTYGKRGGRSCHPSGRAVDVGAIICKGQTYKAINGGRFSEFVGCMRGQMKTLYRNGKHITLGHRDHAHFSNGCHIKGRYTY